MLIILGVDPGFAIVGWGVLEYKSNHFSVLDFGAITTDSKIHFSDRINKIYNELIKIITIYEPTDMAVEKLFFNNNAKTAIDVAQARGVILLAAKQKGLRLCEYTPLQVKQSVTGYGRADKSQVQEMTRIILNLDSVPKPDDTADALAMAITHAHASHSLIF